MATFILLAQNFGVVFPLLIVCIFLQGLPVVADASTDSSINIKVVAEAVFQDVRISIYRAAKVAGEVHMDDSHSEWLNIYGELERELQEEYVLGLDRGAEFSISGDSNHGLRIDCGVYSPRATCVELLEIIAKAISQTSSRSRDWVISVSFEPDSPSLPAGQALLVGDTAFVCAYDSNRSSELAQLLLRTGLRSMPPQDLGEAVLRSDLPAVKRFLAENHDVNEIDESGFKPLYYVRDLQIARLLVASGAQTSVDRSGKEMIDYLDQHRSPELWQYFYDLTYPIHSAIESNKIERIEYAIRSLGMDPNSETRFGVTPLSLSIKMNRLDLAQKLVSLGARAEERSMHEALRNGNLEIAQWLYAEFEMEVDQYMVNVASSGGNLDCLKWALSKGMSYEAASAIGDNLEKTTPLHEVATPECLKYLVELGADIDTPSTGKFGRTPLHSQVANRRVAVVSALLDLGANPNVLDAKGRSPLDRVDPESHPELYSILVRAGAKHSDGL